MLQKCTEMGQGQPADLKRPFPATDPNEGPGGLQGKCVCVTVCVRETDSVKGVAGKCEYCMCKCNDRECVVKL